MKMTIQSSPSPRRQCQLSPHTLGGRSLVAVATDNHSVQSFTREGTPEGLLMRFTAPVTYLSLDHTHCRLAASSCNFTVRIIQLDDVTQVSCLRGHEAPMLCAIFDPRGRYLATTSCDGSMRVWDLENGNLCVKQLQVLHKCNDVSLAKSLATVSWQPPHGKLLAVPVETEVRVCESESWSCVATLRDASHKECVNVVSWKGCGQYLACAGVDGVVSVWNYSNRYVTNRYCNESGIGITSLEWYPDTGVESESDSSVYLPTRRATSAGSRGRGWEDVRSDSGDMLAEDSLLMEGIPPDAIFGTDDIMDDDKLLDDDVSKGTGSHGNGRLESEEREDDDVIRLPHNRRRLMEDSDGETGSAVAAADDVDSLVSGDIDHAPSHLVAPPTKRGEPTNLTAVISGFNSTHVNINVSWESPGGPVTGYVLYYQSKRGAVSSDMVSGGESHLLDGLQRGVTYNISIVALSQHLPSLLVGPVTVISELSALQMGKPLSTLPARLPPLLNDTADPSHTNVEASPTCKCVEFKDMSCTVIRPALTGNNGSDYCLSVADDCSPSSTKDKD